MKRKFETKKRITIVEDCPRCDKQGWVYNRDCTEREECPLCKGEKTLTFEIDYRSGKRVIGEGGEASE